MPAMLAGPGIPYWVELVTPNLEESKKFYSTVMNWDFPDDDERSSAEYAYARKNGMEVAGLAELPGLKAPEWQVMFYAPDLPHSYKQALELGATSVVEPRILNNGVQMAVLTDPSGAQFGLRCETSVHPFFAAGEPGTPVWYIHWGDTHTTETLDFYHELFGWDLRAEVDMSTEMNFTFALYEGSEIAMFTSVKKPEPGDNPIPGNWSAIFGVGDIERASSSALSLGGKDYYAEIEKITPEGKDLYRGETVLEDPLGGTVHVAAIEEPDPDLFTEPDLFGMID